MKIFRLFFIFLFIAILSSQAFATVSLAVKDEDIPKTKILFFGFDSLDPRLKNDALGRHGMYAKVIQAGFLNVGETINVLMPAAKDFLVRKS